MTGIKTIDTITYISNNVIKTPYSKLITMISSYLYIHLIKAGNSLILTPFQHTVP